MEGRRAVRSVTRGIGPVQQRAPLEIDLLIEQQDGRPLTFEPIVPEGPVVHVLIVIGCYFMLREAEASLMLLANVSIDLTREQVTILSCLVPRLIPPQPVWTEVGGAFATPGD